MEIGWGRNQGSLVQVIKNRVSYTGPSTVSSHKQHSQRELFYDQEGTGRGRKEGSLVQVIKRGLAILGPQQLVVISNTHKENYFTIKRGQEGVGK